MPEPGALTEYVRDLGPLAQFYDFSDLAGEVSDAVRETNSPQSWLAYGSIALTDVLGSLPKDVRKAIFDQLFELAQQAISNVPALVDVANEIVGGVETALESIPMFGDLLQLLFQAISGGVELSKDLSSQRWQESRRLRNLQQLATLEGMDEPRKWILELVSLRTYYKYLGEPGKVEPVASKRYRLRPVFYPTCEQLKIFRQSGAPAPSGNCDPGEYVSVNLTGGAKDVDSSTYAGIADYYMSKMQPGSSSNPCGGNVALSCLFFPFYSPSAPAKPVYVLNDSEDPNAVMIERQSLLLMSPRHNLQASGAYLRSIAAKFDAYWQTHSANGLYPVDGDGEADLGAPKLYKIDAARDPKNTGSSNATALYYDAHGLIRAYPRLAGAPVDLTRVGIVLGASEMVGGPSCSMSPAGVRLAVTAASYNTVMSATMAFFTARANFLRSGVFMRGAVEDGYVDSFDAEVRAAVEDAAAQGGANIFVPGEFEPRRRLGFLPPIGVIKRRKKIREILGRSLDRSGGEGGGGAVALALALGVGAFLMARSR